VENCRHNVYPVGRASRPDVCYPVQVLLEGARIINTIEITAPTKADKTGSTSPTDKRAPAIAGNSAGNSLKQLRKSCENLSPERLNATPLTSVLTTRVTAMTDAETNTVLCIGYTDENDWKRIPTMQYTATDKSEMNFISKYYYTPQE